MINNIIYVKGEDDDAGAVFNSETKELITCIDKYHGEEVNVKLLKILGIKVKQIWHSDLIKCEEYECSGYTDEPASLQLLKDRIKELK